MRTGDRVAWQGETSLDALALFFGLAKLGAVFMPVSPRFGADETAAVLAYARPDLVVDDIAPLLAAPAPDDALGPRRSSERAPARDLLHQREHRPAQGRRALAPGELPAQLPVARGRDRRRHGLHVPALPHGRLVALARRVAGAPARCTSSPHPTPTRSLEAAARRQRVAPLRDPRGVGPHPRARRRTTSISRALREADTGTSATPPELVAAIRDALPHTVTRVFYGSTEAGPGTILGAADVLRKPGSVGLPQAGVSLRLTAEGEVCLRSELLMDGYFDDPDATAAALDADGWYHSGDLGALDDEGYLSIVGRVRDVIRTGGESVAPTEVEAVLAAHPAVAEVAVIGVPDAQWGEIVCAVVVAVGAARARRSPRVLPTVASPASSSRAGSSSSPSCPAPPRPARCSARSSSSGSPHAAPLTPAADAPRADGAGCEPAPGFGIGFRVCGTPFPTWRTSSPSGRWPIGRRPTPTRSGGCSKRGSP